MSNKNLSILQWNIWYQEDIRNIVKLLKQVDADVICLQELTIDNPDQPVQNTVEFIAKELGYHYAHQEIILDNDKIKLANGIFSRYPITNKHTAWINEPIGTNHYDDEYRAYIEATIEVDGIQLQIGTVHMSYTNAFEVTDRKLQETDKLLEEIKNKKEHFILAGDFNAQPDSEVIKRLSKHLVNAGPDFKEKSWTTKLFSYDGFEASTLDWRLDYVFTTPDVEIKESRVLNTDFSDHLPISVKIRVK